MIEPIRRRIVVRCSAERAFEVFTGEMSSWWPFEVFSIAADTEGEAQRVVVEPHAGGRIYEVLADGTQVSWGEVRTWDPPGRLVLAWKPNDRPQPPTELELTFAEHADGTTVVLEHRGWELLGPLADESRENYDAGWPMVFDERYANAANSGARTAAPDAP
jgi:uncharacterized protein YndB with AHSA1/START domain